MDIEALRKAANPHTGLVPLRITRAFMPYEDGQVAGFPPEVALGYINVGAAEVYKAGKDDAKNPMLGMTGPAPLSHGAPPAQHGQVLTDRSTIYSGRPEVTPRAQVAPPTNQDPTSTPQPAQIPENWEEFEGAELRKLAANLSGRRYQELSVDESRLIIEAAKKGEPLPSTSGDQNVIRG